MPRGSLSKYWDPVDWRIQREVDRLAPNKALRWVLFALSLSLYAAWVWFRPGWFLVTYGLCVHLLNLVVGLITPVEDDDGRPLLPTSVSGPGVDEREAWSAPNPACACAV